MLAGLNEALGDATGDDARRPAVDPCPPSGALAVPSGAPAAALRTRPVLAALAAAQANLVDAAEFIGEGFRFLDEWLACGDVAARLFADDLYLAARTKLRLARGPWRPPPRRPDAFCRPSLVVPRWPGWAGRQGREGARRGAGDACSGRRPPGSA